MHGWSAHGGVVSTQVNRGRKREKRRETKDINPVMAPPQLDLSRMYSGIIVSSPCRDPHWAGHEDVPYSL